MNIVPQSFVLATFGGLLISLNACESNINNQKSPGASVTDNSRIAVASKELLNKYKLDYKKGMKWVYRLTNRLEFSNGSFSDLEDNVSNQSRVTIEIIKAEGDLLTLHSIISPPKKQVPNTVKLVETTVKKEDFDLTDTNEYHTPVINSLVWTSSNQTESISLPAGFSYNTEVIIGNLTPNVSSRESESHIKLWMSNRVGMVKKEITINILAGGLTGNSIITLELQSFSE